MTGYRQARARALLDHDPGVGDLLQRNPDGKYIWQNLYASGRDIVDPQRYAAALHREAVAKRPPKFMSTQDAINRRVGFIVMDYS